jgi:tetratricopeptide (TPR) repeat protein
MYADAETLFQTVIKKNPVCWMAYNNLGNIFSLTNKTDIAVSNYQKSLEIKPDYGEAHYNLGKGAFPFCDHYLLSFVTPMGSVANRNRSFQRPAL